MLVDFYKAKPDVFLESADTNKLIRTDNILGDEYLSSLRNFVPSHNQKNMHKSAYQESL